LSPLDLLETLPFFVLEEGVDKGKELEDGVGGKGKARKDSGNLGVSMAESDGVGKVKGGDMG
jgi:hypothetical protein